MASQDFYGLQEYGGNFLTEPLDYNFGNMGNVRASYDPETGPGAEIKVMPSKSFYVKTGWFMPSDDGERHPYPTGFDYKNGHYGSTWDVEGGFFTDAGAPATRKSYPGIYKVGFIYNGSKAGTYSSTMGFSGFPNYSKQAYTDHNYTFYVQANQPVYRVAAGSNRGVDVTVGFNIGDQSKSEVPTEVTAGLIFNGPIKCRPKDALSFGLVFSKIGSDFNNFLKSIDVASLNNETELEINYRIQVAPWFTLQPVYQYYNNVGGTGNSASVAGFRLVTTF
jgi:porin